MRWLKRKLAKWVEEGNHDSWGLSSMDKMGQALDALSDTPSMHFKNPMNITLYKVVGGHIVKFQRYSEKRGDDDTETTYIIGAGENLEESLAKFITMESIKHVK